LDLQESRVLKWFSHQLIKEVAYGKV
jgi:hypothetical protein